MNDNPTMARSAGGHMNDARDDRAEPCGRDDRIGERRIAAWTR